ncbi:MAG: hypothetical protein JWM82_472, partial [Myxococcales bacterium]|nr:hypothetical protein [Myxococcales bacterium]
MISIKRMSNDVRVSWLVVAVALSLAAASVARADGAPLVDLNTASEAALTELPGVGPATAKAIVAGRPFASVDDLAKVKGIGPAKLAALRGKVSVGGAAAKPAPSMPATIPAAPPPAAA